MSDDSERLLEMTVTANGSETIVALRGELDMSEAPHLAALLESIQAPAIIIDLSELTFLDSSGLGALIVANREDRPLRLRSASAAVARVLEVSGVDQLLATDEG